MGTSHAAQEQGHGRRRFRAARLRGLGVNVRRGSDAQHHRTWRTAGAAKEVLSADSEFDNVTTEAYVDPVAHADLLVALKTSTASGSRAAPSACRPSTTPAFRSARPSVFQLLGGKSTLPAADANGEEGRRCCRSSGLWVPDMASLLEQARARAAARRERQVTITIPELDIDLACDVPTDSFAIERMQKPRPRSTRAVAPQPISPAPWSPRRPARSASAARSWRSTASGGVQRPRAGRVGCGRREAGAVVELIGTDADALTIATELMTEAGFVDRDGDEDPTLSLRDDRVVQAAVGLGLMFPGRPDGVHGPARGGSAVLLAMLDLADKRLRQSRRRPTVAGAGDRLQIVIGAKDELSAQLRRTRKEPTTLGRTANDIQRRMENGSKGTQNELEKWTRREIVQVTAEHKDLSARPRSTASSAR